jgi:cytochrome c peroxidase
MVAAKPASVISWGRVVRIGWLVGVAVMTGCWSSDLIDGAFTPEQWAKLQELELPPPPDPCQLAQLTPMQCGPATQLAKALFFDNRLSGNATLSCASCHDRTRGFIDSRMPDNVSAALTMSGFTARNSMTLLNVAYKETFATGDHDAFTWSGGQKLKTCPGKPFTSAGSVLELAVTVPMGSSKTIVADVVRNDGGYLMLYTAAFGTPDFDDVRVFGNLARAFEAYLATLVTGTTPFDAWLRGDPTAMSKSAQRGFAVFVGKGTCFECHNGPLFSDLQFHDTGVPQKGEHVPTVTPDLGRGGVTCDPDDNGKFLTAGLRDIAATGPYMHDGVFETLTDVITFYRSGGVSGSYSGTRDPRITPLDLTDADAADLEAFLRSLSDHDCDDDSTMCGSGGGMGSGGGSGSAMPDAGVVDAPPVPCAPPFMLCPAGCFNLQTDPMHCGSCTTACINPNLTCAMGQCAP